MSQAQQAQMMKELEELQMRESLKLYNLLSEMCFNKCVNTFHGKELDSEETGCMHTCVATIDTTIETACDEIKMYLHFALQGAGCLEADFAASVSSPRAHEHSRAEMGMYWQTANPWKNIAVAQIPVYKAFPPVSGVVQILLTQQIDYEGLDGAKTALTVLSSYLGLLLISMPLTFCRAGDALPGGGREGNYGSRKYHPLMPVTLACDILGNIASQFSIVYCGSLLYMVVYSSITVFSALIRWRVYDKPLSRQKWMAVGCITVGLTLTMVGADVGSDASVDSGSLGLIFFGMVLALCGAIFYALVYVLTEQIMDAGETTPSPLAMATFTGFYGSLCTSVYILLFVGPSWSSLVLRPAKAKGSTYAAIVAQYVLLLAMCGAHNLSFVFTSKETGAVVAGVNKSLQTISVFIFSAIFFGNEHIEQRFTVGKGLSLIFVIVGVLLYSSSARAESSADGEGGKSIEAVRRSEYSAVSMQDASMKDAGQMVEDDDEEFGLQ
eukprot:g2754.t1